MESIFQIIITVVCSVVASSGFWAFLQSREHEKDAKTDMLISKYKSEKDRLAQEIVGVITGSAMPGGSEHKSTNKESTNPECENLYEYLYKPYKQLGGNGSAKRVMTEVDKLPIRKKVEVQTDDHA